MDREVVKEEDWDDPTRYVFNILCEDLFDPLHHDDLVKPCLLLAPVDEVSGQRRKLVLCDRTVSLACGFGQKVIELGE